MKSPKTKSVKGGAAVRVQRPCSATARPELVEAATIAAEYLTGLKRKLNLDFIGYGVLDKLEAALRESPNTALGKAREK